MTKDSTQKVAQSLETLLKQLAHDAHLASEKSGDREHYKNTREPLSDLYDDYWFNQYQPIFFSAYFSLPEDLQKDKDIWAVAQKADEIYDRGLKDKEGCFAYSKENWNTPNRLAKLSFFDGKAEKPLIIGSFDEVRKKMKHAGILF